LTVDDDPLSDIPRAGKLRYVLLDARPPPSFTAADDIPISPIHHHYEATHVRLDVWNALVSAMHRPRTFPLSRGSLSEFDF
jgi:hypothetical protein